MSKQLSWEEKTRLVQAVHSAVNHYDKSKRKTVSQACEDLGLARSNYNRWRYSVQKNLSETGAAIVPPPKSRAPKKNGKALREEGASVSNNTVQNNLEAVGLYGYRSVVGSDGNTIKKKVLLR